MAFEQEHPVRDAAVDLLGGTPSSVERDPVDPATFVLPPALAEAVRSFDRAVDRRFDGLRGNPTVDRAMYGASALGDFSLLWHLIGVSRALQGRKQEREALRLAASLAVESVLINGVVKSWFRRARPDWEQHRPRKLRKPRSSSFPSGHATSGFMAAGLLGAGRSTPTKAAWYAAATVVAASRVHVRIHHASDVVAGAAIGLGLGAAAKRWWPLRE
jgi:undecaprenyl-diphosphatase